MMKRVGIKLGKADPLGRFHRAAIQKVADVPKAASGFPNTTPGNSDKPVIMKKDK